MHGVFQSPSLRGSGRFPGMTTGWLRGASRFNPLHCGAVVASGAEGSSGPRARVSIPFIAGQWSLRAGRTCARRSARRVSIPFIAGQWSLPGRTSCPGLNTSSFNPLHCGAVVASCHLSRVLLVPAPGFNPLHCGAVVASSRRRAETRASVAGLNPLHCGAVVASIPSGQRLRCHPLVSIPFIAGQWSLRKGLRPRNPHGFEFQSPSLRGSGRFPLRSTRRHGRRRVSIPFIAGQWSLHPERSKRLNNQTEFQSPSLRGSGRF